MLTDDLVQRVWKEAAEMDRTVRIWKTDLLALRRKLVSSERYSRHTMFRHMAQGQVAIFRDVPVVVRGHSHIDTPAELATALTTCFPPRTSSRVQIGPSHRETRLEVREILRRWSGKRAIVGVTDLHIRNTRAEKAIDTHVLSHFNMLIRGSAELANQEMMTLVIASPGNVTDSHSDDPDGTNHCFFGKKLWLAWDTFEGLAAGLQDVERCAVYGSARFHMSRFLSLNSSRWFVVSSGDTLFLPGHLTHKVFTLEPYLGVGSFYISLPSSLATLTRWLWHRPLWAINDATNERAGLVDDAARTSLRIARCARNGSDRCRERWGFRYLPEAFAVWRKRVPTEVRRSVLTHPSVRSLIDVARDAASMKGYRLA